MVPEVRFDRNARYGAALVGVLFAGFLNIATDFSAFIQAANYAGVLGTDVPAVDFAEFVLIIGIYLAAFILMPASGARRLGAVTLACVVLLLWATIGIERGVGNIDHPVAFWTFVVNQGLITLVVALGGWLLVRGRHPLAFLVLLLALIPPLVSVLLVQASATTGAYILVSEGTVIVLGIGGAWLAALIDRLVRGRSQPSVEDSVDEGRELSSQRG
ncbi:MULTISPECIES: hypothetical protein [unclassified Microbacterium]|uniref:hypothetical protein n=1 Tax=unclassified Microbacterium TaxID=2609290 RepID=UPI00214B5F6D|nr:MULTISPECIES: hypothetical protein [unclassified Microbacterium]MCR2808998.1 hypothetical protein [Microbacterium sp. zg.B185]WIM18590.1 hypothetical protein QNO12_13465 [Microbacterium sp. zg-B185]